MGWEALLDSSDAAFVQQEAHCAGNRAIDNSCCPEAKVYDILDKYQLGESMCDRMAHLEAQVKAMDHIDSLPVLTG